jgi:hypothetical protein
MTNLSDFTPQTSSSGWQPMIAVSLLLHGLIMVLPMAEPDKPDKVETEEKVKTVKLKDLKPKPSPKLQAKSVQLNFQPKPSPKPKPPSPPKPATQPRPRRSIPPLSQRKPKPTPDLSPSPSTGPSPSPSTGPSPSPSTGPSPNPTADPSPSSTPSTPVIPSGSVNNTDPSGIPYYQIQALQDYVTPESYSVYTNSNQNDDLVFRSGIEQGRPEFYAPTDLPRGESVIDKFITPRFSPAGFNPPVKLPDTYGGGEVYKVTKNGSADLFINVVRGGGPGAGTFVFYMDRNPAQSPLG